MAGKSVACMVFALLVISMVSSSIPSEAARLVQEVSSTERSGPICPACVCCDPPVGKPCCECCTGPIGPIETEANQP